MSETHADLNLENHLPHWMINALAAFLLVSGLSLCFAGKKILDLVPFVVLIGYFAALAAYQVVVGNQQFLEVGSILHHLMDMFGAWNLIILTGIIVTLYTSFFRQMCLILGAGELGWLLSSPLFLIVYVVAGALGREPGPQFLFAFRLLCVALMMAAMGYTVVRTMSQPFVARFPALATTIMGAYLSVSGVDHLLFAAGLTPKECFWPDVRFESYHRTDCKASLGAFGGLMFFGGTVQFLCYARWGGDEERELKYRPLPDHARERARRAWGLDADSGRF